MTRDSELASAIQFHADGRLDDAGQIYQRLHAANRQDTEVIYLMGMLCCDLGLFEPARRLLEEAVSVTPAFPEARRQLAVALTALAGETLASGDAAAAEALLEQSMRQRTDDAETLNWLGLARLQIGKHAAAEAPLRQALKLQPDLHQARNNLGLSLQSQNRLVEAQRCFEQVLAATPEHHPARINLADVLRVTGNPSGARRELETVLAAQPDSIEALNNLGAVLQDLGEASAALSTLRRAWDLAQAGSAIPQTRARIRWNMSLTELQLGNFSGGWVDFEHRWEGCDHLRNAYRFPKDRVWRGESLEGKRLLLWAEQGFGDTIQFIRFAIDASRRGARVTAVVHAELQRLLQSIPGLGAVLRYGDPLPAWDFHCPVMSMPHRLQVTADAESVHGNVPYLSAPDLRVEPWTRRLADFTGFKVGLAWAGSARHYSAALASVDARRSIAPVKFGPLMAVPGCTFFSLQKIGVWPANGPGKVHDFSSQWRDFADTAAFIANLDLVISVDTAVVHLAGAMGKPVWLLNRFDSCWRWQLGRSDSPWYATLRQFRQPEHGNWECVIGAAAAALAELVQRA